jgi:ethanolamine utilization protein EutA
MHDLDFDHGHVSVEEQQALAEAIWNADNVELTTVGIDVGSSTSHLMFARVHMQRLTTALSSRFVVVGREVLWRSPILLTPYVSDNTIDVKQLAVFFDSAFKEAGLTRDKIDSGAVILTGEALKRNNAEAITHLFAAESGKFVCASAGHHMECAMAGHGSGAGALSRKEKTTVMNIDIGGGTTKFALIDKGQIIATAAVEAGGRLIAFDENNKIVRLEGPALRHAAKAGVEVALGKVLTEADKQKIVDTMVEVMLSVLDQGKLSGIAEELMVTEPLPHSPKPTLITFSGGVAEYIFEREATDRQDLGKLLGRSIVAAVKSKRISAKVVDPGQGIRATVIGASQFSVQVSGNTISISNEKALPMRNVPVLHPNVDLGDTVDSELIANEIKRAHTRFDFTEGEQPVALAFRWKGDPLHARLKALADGIHMGLHNTIREKKPLVLVLDGDIARTIGEILRRECDVAGDIVSVDGVQLREFDYVDIGEMIRPTNVVPLVIKSLLFSSPGMAKA